MEAGRLEGWTARKACNVASRVKSKPANWQTTGNTKSKKSMRDYIQVVVFKFNTKRLAGDYNGVSLVFGVWDKGKRNQELQYST